MKCEKLQGTYAEFIVAQALNVETLKGIGLDLYDIIYKEHKIVVKSSDATAPVFDISVSDKLSKRASDLHIFALYHGETADEPHNKNLWNFWVLSTPNVDRTFEREETVSLNLIMPIAIMTNYDGLKSAVDLTISV